MFVTYQCNGIVADIWAWRGEEPCARVAMTTDISVSRWDPSIGHGQEIIDEFEYDGGNSSSRLFERSRIKALAGELSTHGRTTIAWPLYSPTLHYNTMKVLRSFRFHSIHYYHNISLRSFIVGHKPSEVSATMACPQNRLNIYSTGIPYSFVRP